MAYLSQFEVISEYIVPPVLLPPGTTVPFSLKGYFVALSRLEADGVPGDLQLRLRFFPTVPFPPSTNILVDEQDAAGATKILALGANHEVDVALPRGKTILVGVQPNFTNGSPTGPLVATFGVRGYVTLQAIAPSAAGNYRVGVLPEHRVVFASLTTSGAVTTADFTGSTSIAYALPTPAPVVEFNV